MSVRNTLYSSTVCLFTFSLMDCHTYANFLAASNDQKDKRAIHAQDADGIFCIRFLWTSFYCRFSLLIRSKFT